jgi:hypothetical protein
VLLGSVSTVLISRSAARTCDRCVLLAAVLMATSADSAELLVPAGGMLAVSAAVLLISACATQYLATRKD